MEDEKRLFYEKLDEYESKLPQKYDREKSCYVASEFIALSLLVGIC
jgi:hypothetical protein